MKFKPDEIASVIQKEIEDFRGQIETAEVGRVLEVGDGIARCYGLSSAMSGEMVEFKGGVRGQVFNLEENSVGVIILGDYLKIAEGDEVRTTGALLSVPTGDALIGRVVDPLGNPLDGKGPIMASSTRPLEYAAPGIAGRQPVKQPLQTGIKAVDSMTPIGRGQRELIIGDRKTGKTAVAIDTIINQKGGDVICVYVACGQRASNVAAVYEKLKEAGAMDYTIIVSSTSSDPAPLQYIAPYAGCAMAEHFTYNGKHTLVVYDDLTRQAQAYRQLSLLVRRPPGREAYPGDVFYCHSRLLERSAKLSNELGGGSLTALPIIETLDGEVSAYIPTNVISITDGQIYLEPSLFLAGIRPAINVGISVSRVGGNAQNKAMKKIAGSLRLDLAAFRELEAFAQLGTELDKATQKQLDRGYRMVELLKQPQYVPLHVADQVISIYAGTRGYFDDVPRPDVAAAERELLNFMREQKSEVRNKLIETGTLDEATETALKAALDEFKRQYAAGTPKPVVTQTARVSAESQQSPSAHKPTPKQPPSEPPEVPKPPPPVKSVVVPTTTTVAKEGDAPMKAIEYWNRAIASAEKGRDAEALSDFERAIEMDPNYYISVIEPSSSSARSVWRVAVDHYLEKRKAKAADSKVSTTHCHRCEKPIGINWTYGFESISYGGPVGAQCVDCGLMLCKDHMKSGIEGRSVPCPNCNGKLETLYNGAPFRSMVAAAVRKREYRGALKEPSVLGRPVQEG